MIYDGLMHYKIHLLWKSATVMHTLPDDLVWNYTCKNVN
jgi:hypothetical protein